MNASTSPTTVEHEALAQFTFHVLTLAAIEMRGPRPIACSSRFNEEADLVVEISFEDRRLILINKWPEAFFDTTPEHWTLISEPAHARDGSGVISGTSTDRRSARAAVYARLLDLDGDSEAWKRFWG